MNLSPVNVWVTERRNELVKEWWMNASMNWYHPVPEPSFFQWLLHWAVLYFLVRFLFRVAFYLLWTATLSQQHFFDSSLVVPSPHAASIHCVLHARAATPQKTVVLYMLENHHSHSSADKGTILLLSVKPSLFSRKTNSRCSLARILRI